MEPVEWVGWMNTPPTLVLNHSLEPAVESTADPTLLDLHAPQSGQLPLNIRKTCGPVGIKHCR